ncbi:MAG: type IX secretion system membrane protein PorP/SprF [Saprospiraceae bacterium]
MKKYLPLIIIFCLSYSINFKAQISSSDNALFAPFAQSAPPSINVLDFNSISNYHFFNSFAFNPAMAGIEDKRRINFDWNRQNYHSVSTSYEQPIAAINSAIGVHYEFNINDFNKTHRYGLAYNYGFRWKENTQLRLGVQFSQINVKVKDFTLPLDRDKWYNFPSLDLGIAFQFKQLRLGASVQNLIPREFAKFSERTESYINQVDTERTLNFSAANTFQFTKNWDWSVAALMRFYNHEIIEDIIYGYGYPSYYLYEGNKKQHDFSSYISFQKRYTIGATYRTQHDPVWIGFVGVKLKEKLNLLFSFNMDKHEGEPRFWEALTQYQF